MTSYLLLQGPPQCHQSFLFITLSASFLNYKGHKQVRGLGCEHLGDGYVAYYTCLFHGLLL